MIQGAVNARHEAVVRLRVRGPGGAESDVDAIVDSGFTASLTLPMATVTALGLARQSDGIEVLADGPGRAFSLAEKNRRRLRFDARTENGPLPSSRAFLRRYNAR